MSLKEGGDKRNSGYEAHPISRTAASRTPVVNF